MIPTYEDGRYLRDALGSVLVQDPGAELMQIEVVDDRSTNDPTPLVRELCGDRVTVHRHAVNRGHVATFNTCIERAGGQFVHLLHADDQVREGFYERLGDALSRRPDVGAAFCRYIAIDEHGNWTNIAPLEQATPGILEHWHETLALGQRLQPPCIVVRKGVYERIGMFDTRIRSYGEDWEMWTRIAASYPVWYEPEPLALYRIGNDSLSSSALRTGDNIRQLLQVIEINREGLPAHLAGEITAKATRETAITALQRAVRLARRGDSEGAIAQLKWSVRADASPATLVRVLAALLRVASAHARIEAARLSNRLRQGQ